MDRRKQGNSRNDMNYTCFYSLKRKSLYYDESLFSAKELNKLECRVYADFEISKDFLFLTK